jgi:hypothetical protein
MHSPAQAALLAAKPAGHTTNTAKVTLGLVLPAASCARHVTVVLPSGNAAVLPAL